ncbi:hypothetical protein DASC09_003640 [Saccharomycopsis crataegensis]|uniref:Mss4-like protein n=1 Tax=Saccharomycopsis crataegensis TaxID=43959 RepID=A0AAV5QE95_9ASCO|nr:hypothetical protein DASC09_003640 [Saccharomycopsis crataegensis]
MTSVSFNSLIDQLNSAEEVVSYKEILLRCPFSRCNCRIIPFKYHLSSFDDKNTVQISETPECAVVDNATLEVINPQTSKDEESTKNKNKKKKFFKIGDAWDFDNIGVSRPSDIAQPIIHGAEGSSGPVEDQGKINIQRYLVCADCDRGPLGFAGFVVDEDEKKYGEEEEEDGDARIKNANKLVYFLSCDSVKYELR